MSITPEQARMARAALNWTLARAAASLGVGRATLVRIEAGTQGVKTSTLQHVRTGYLKRGIRFLRDRDYAGVALVEKEDT